ncbi:GNAT family N-acetyltransferase [Varunaivibrio sulfuroxidans]|uniref:Uncharacterized protein n=1 Tax=Varunaivibrio sulfuroxidans TaxID=1773489 RepID=A0A4R3J8K7_9PROT|nr:GNAT family N-acetyltransferase [Varunaivibrio sulfuroxidans]TCS61256.1 hypothetical protein EDD55_10855 [Varunaivibrio sulfuroxidans]WES31123.1 GNAT family N-acetyltransferase [Varunaivibrio sulfuroxidans]
MEISLLEAIGDISADAWDICAGGVNPFVSHAFLSALEDSATLGAQNGWLVRHVVAHAPSGRLVACAPMYVKSHSYGEYVFDWAWADAYERAGGRYYPKLLCAAPFTPVAGPRLLVHPDAPEGTKALLIDAMVDIARRMAVSSLHVTFPDKNDWAALGSKNFIPRIGRQYHWSNPGYADFDAFLAALSSRKRKQIRKERRTALGPEREIEVVRLNGADIHEEHWDALYRFYMDTGARKWGRPYLNRTFFSLLGERMADRVLLIMARRGGRWIAGALNLIGSDGLYGRYWGAVEHVPCLHFEICYYQAIEYAITHRLKTVEAGAQGEHKIARGYLPVETYSAHWVRDDGFRDALERAIEAERDAVAEEIDELADFSPFRAPSTPK